MYQQALKYFFINDYANAIKTLLKIMHHDNNAKVLLGIIYNLSGNELKAIDLFNEVLKIEVNYDALINIGHSYYSLKDYQNAIKNYTKCFEINDKNNNVNLLIGNCYFALDDNEKAENYFLREITINPQKFEGFNNLGELYLNKKQYIIAKKYLEKAIMINTESCDAYNNLGIINNKLNNLDLSLEYFDLAIKHNNLMHVAYFNKATVFEKISNYKETVNNYKTAINIYKNIIYLYNLANIYYKNGDFDNSIEIIKECLKINPNFAKAYNILGLINFNNCNYKESEKNFQKSIEIDSKSVEAHNNIGLLYLNIKDYIKAEYHFQVCISAETTPQYLFNLAITYREQFNYKLFQKLINKAIELDPNIKKIVWAKVFLSIYPIYENIIQEKISINNFTKEIKELKFIKLSNYESNLIGGYQPFYLAYFENNYLEQMRIYGEISNEIINNDIKIDDEDEDEDVGESKDQKIKIGIVSSYFRNHSVWDAITKGLVSNLDTEKFDIHIFNTSRNLDNDVFNTIPIKSFSSIQGNSLKEFAYYIKNKKLNIIIYPEIGMDSSTTILANLRLSKVQCVFWGHPQTTGIKTIDYFISADLFEPDNYQENYTEKVIKLPNLGVYKYSETNNEDYVDLKKLGISIDIPIFICAGTLQKYRAYYDFVFVEIVRKIVDCQFIFFNEDSYKSKIFIDRLESLFTLNNLDINKHVKFVKWLSIKEFRSLLRQSDVYLDSIAFSGFNTALMAIEENLPVITLKGKYLKSRLASGILERIKLNELICENTKDYINKSIQIVKDKEYKLRIKDLIRSNKKIIYNDLSAIRKFEIFILNSI